MPCELLSQVSSARWWRCTLWKGRMPRSSNSASETEFGSSNFQAPEPGSTWYPGGGFSIISYYIKSIITVYMSFNLAYNLAYVWHICWYAVYVFSAPSWSLTSWFKRQTSHDFAMLRQVAELVKFITIMSRRWCWLARWSRWHFCWKAQPPGRCNISWEMDLETWILAEIPMSCFKSLSKICIYIHNYTSIWLPIFIFLDN